MKDRVQNFRDTAKRDTAKRDTAKRDLVVLPFLLIALLAVVLPLTTSHGTGAEASASSRAVRATSITSGSWAIVAHGRSQPVRVAPYILVWTVAGGTAYDYFSLRNVGTTLIRSFRVFITQVRLTGTPNAREIFFEQCSGGSWDPLTHLCSGTIIQVGRASDGLLVLSNTNIASNEFLDMRARTLPNNQSTFETTLSTQITRSDIRAAQVGNS